MNFRTQHIADSVVQRIQAVAKNTKAPITHRGAATINLERSSDGNLIVTKTFEHGEPEIMTISGQSAAQETPPGFTDITPNQESGVSADSGQPGIAGDQGGIVENAALGGNAIDALLKA